MTVEADGGWLGLCRLDTLPAHVAVEADGGGLGLCRLDTLPAHVAGCSPFALAHLVVVQGSTRRD